MYGNTAGDVATLLRVCFGGNWTGTNLFLLRIAVWFVSDLTFDRMLTRTKGCVAVHEAMQNQNCCHAYMVSLPTHTAATDISNTQPTAAHTMARPALVMRGCV